jgi:hypothetical protein
VAFILTIREVIMLAVGAPTVMLFAALVVRANGPLTAVRFAKLEKEDSKAA